MEKEFKWAKNSTSEGRVVRYEVTVDNGKDKDLLLVPLSERQPPASDPQFHILLLVLFWIRRRASCRSVEVDIQEKQIESIVSDKIRK